MKKPQKRAPARKKKSKNRSKNKSDALQAFQLAALLVLFAAGISLAIIFIHSNFIKPRAAEPDNSSISAVTAVPDPDPENAQAQPQISVSVEQPAEQTQTTSSGTNAHIGTSGTSQTGTSSAVQTGTSSAAQTGTSSAAQTGTSSAVSAVIPVVPVEKQGDLVFVIDDAGNNLRELEPFLKIPSPLTIAVLPALPYSAEAARRIRAAGKEVILHQPMEAIGAQAPGPGAIYSGMTADEIRAVLAKNIAEVGPVAGMNNHQGSKITMDREMMETILAFCAENGIYFLDSRTTAETAVPAAARRLGIKIAERDTFLDNEQDRESMLNYLTAGLARAKRNGSAVMIGHTWSPALAPLLAEQIPVLIGKGYNIKSVSDILK